MRKLLCAMLVLALLAVPVMAVSVSAESAVDEDIVVSDLLPTDTSQIETTDCEATVNSDGSLTIRITGDNPALKIKLAEGSTLYTGRDIDLSEDAYVAVDCGVAGNIVISHMILHYTRKDKAAAGQVADLYLQSMYSPDYAAYRVQVDEGTYDSSNPWPNGSSHYVVWNWGKYLNDDADKKLFDDKMHHFVDIDIELGSATTMKSTIGSELTFYTIAVVSDPDVELGTVTPNPIEDDPTGEDSEEESTDDSEAESEGEDSEEESTDDSEAESEEESVPESVEESSEEEPTDESSEDPTDTSADSTPSTAASTDSTSSAAGTGSTAEEGGSGNTGIIIGIIAAVVVVIGVVVGVVVAKKKK